MANGVYIGADNIAAKVKKVYVGVDDVANKVKKAYVGDANGIARLCWSAEAQFKTGTFTDNRRYMGASGEQLPFKVVISDLPFRPVGILGIGISDTLYEATGEVSTPAVFHSLDSLAGGFESAYGFEGTQRYRLFDGDLKITFGNNSVTLSIVNVGNVGGGWGGTYYYAVWGEDV